MYVFMCLYVLLKWSTTMIVCMCACVFEYVYVWLYSRVSVYVCMCVCVCIYVCVCVSILNYYICVCMCMRVGKCKYVCVCGCLCWPIPILPQVGCQPIEDNRSDGDECIYTIEQRKRNIHTYIHTIILTNTSGSTGIVLSSCFVIILLILARWVRV